MERTETGRRKGQSELATKATGLTDDPFYRAVLDAIDDRAILELDADGRIVRWSGGAERMTGYGAADAIGRSYAELLGGWEDARARAASGGRERWWRCGDGERVQVRETVRAFERDDGVVGYAIVAADPTDRLAADSEARALRQREGDALVRERELRTEVQAASRRAAFLAEASSILVATSLNFDSTIRGLARLAVSRLAEWCIVYTLSDDGVIRRMQAAHRDPRREEVLRDVVGTELRGEAGHPVLDAIGNRHAILFDRLPDDFWKSHERTQPAFAGLRAELGGGPVMVVPLIARGKALGAVAFIASSRAKPYDEEDLDLAEELGRRAALAIDNARLYREAQDANRAKADFLAIMSHELRTPLNAVLGYVDLIDAEISGPVTPKQRKQLGRVRASARHLLQLIEEILSFARMEAGGEELRLELIRAHDLIDEVTSVIAPLASAKGLDLEVRKDKADVVLQTDPGKARQILVNVLSNAVKFTDEGEISLAFGRERDDAVFTIRDTGIGIPVEDLDRIFDPFWQGERPMTRRLGGTGLGLSVSRRFARLLRGEIEVESTPGAGATFRIRLPARAGIALDRAAFTGRTGSPAVS